jgi:hypothetical protein
MDDLHQVHVKKNQIGHVNTAIFEMARVRDQLESECLRAVAKLIGMEGATLLEGHWKCPSSPTEQCLYEIKADSRNEDCLFCGQSLTR